MRQHTRMATGLNGLNERIRRSDRISRLDRVGVARDRDSLSSGIAPVSRIFEISLSLCAQQFFPSRWCIKHERLSVEKCWFFSRWTCWYWRTINSLWVRHGVWVFCAFVEKLWWDCCFVEIWTGGIVWVLLDLLERSWGKIVGNFGICVVYENKFDEVER